MGKAADMTRNKIREVPVGSVRKALDILSVLLFEDQHGEGFALSELAGRMDIPVNTAHNLLKTMLYCGYVAQNGRGRYICGPVCRRIGGANFVDSDVFQHRLEAVFAHYSAILNEVLVFTAVVAGKRQVIARSDPGKQAICINSKIIDKNCSIYRTVTGRAMIANAENREYRNILEQNGDIFREWPDYERDIRMIRAAGYAESMDERNLISSCAVALRTESGTLGAIGCYLPAFRCPPGMLRRIAGELQKARAELISTTGTAVS